MTILIVTQTVDSDDVYLGFFVRWIEEFAKHVERVEVICLREGEHSLPANVRIHSLGKENIGNSSRSGTSEGTLQEAVSRKFKYGIRFLRLVWQLRNDYDAVFVHMNPEYVVLGGPLWRVWNKKIALWYTHKSVTMKLRVAAFLADIIFTASKESFRLKNKKVRVMGHGIDTNFFSQGSGVVRGEWALSVGRLMQSKRHDLAMRRAKEEGRELHIVGEGPERAHLEALARELQSTVHFLGGLSQMALRDEYRTARVLLHTSETGSLDKVTLEALSCGLPIQTNDPALKPLEQASPEYVREHHSLERLIPALLSTMKSV